MSESLKWARPSAECDFGLAFACMIDLTES